MKLGNTINAEHFFLFFPAAPIAEEHLTLLTSLSLQIGTLSFTSVVKKKMLLTFSTGSVWT